MSKTTRSKAEIDDVKNGILDEALTLLRNEGYEKLSMYKLGKRTNMTAANLYNYYKNKDQLIIAIQKKTFELLYNELIAATQNETDPIQKVRKIILAFVDFGKNNPNYYDLMFNRRIPQTSDYAGTPEEALSREEYQSSIRNLTLVISIGKEIVSSHPELKQINAEFHFFKIFSELHGLLSLYNSRILKEMVENPDQLINSIIEDIFGSYLKAIVH